MSVARRNYFVPPDGMRCVATAKAAAGNPDGRCMRRKMVGDLCTQHAKVKQANLPSTSRSPR